MVKIPQQLMKMNPLPIDGHVMLAHRHAGVQPLPVIETTPGVYTSAWIVDKNAVAMIRKGPAAITLVVDTNVPGHPGVSMKIQKITLRDDKPPTQMTFPKGPK
jgi:hypothetical protein